MADISKITDINGVTYDLKDKSAIANITCSGANFVATKRDGTEIYFSTIPPLYIATAADVAAKTAECGGYVATADTWVPVIVVYANSYAGELTLNINGAGAKTIYINDEVSDSTNYTLPAGTYLVYYDGTNYYFRTDGYLTPTVTVGSASDWSSGTTPSLAYSNSTISAVNSAGSAPSLSYTAKTVKSVKSAGSAPGLTITSTACDDITAWSAGTMFSASYGSETLTLSAGTAPSLSYTARTVGSASGWSAGSATTTEDIACDDITAWDAGSATTTTNVNVSEITSWDAGSAPSLTITNKSVAKGIGV